MIQPPEYYESIRAKAVKRWEQLESDPDLAGPWHQLFKQVQSPRHVVSELLQNADDAEATSAWIRIEDNEFIFEHNGQDFTDEHFSSLCKFGYSNKRNLHTIGFRGVGFKSTFSLGDEVELNSPTLSIVFHKSRFTEPKWKSCDRLPRTTQVRVRIKDEHRYRDLQKNINDWLRSPLSLIFFRHIKQLTIEDTQIQRQFVGYGPVKGSEWVKLSEQQNDPFLLIRSDLEYFPEESEKEIREERMGTEDLDFPPCQVDLVVGLENDRRLFVVLPTGVETELPFAVNAPFIQDPARYKIKDPATSPTNRWLLERAGRLAAETMLSWIQKDSISMVERCNSYMLFPDDYQDSDTLESACTKICITCFDETIKTSNFILTEEDTLVNNGECISVDYSLYNIWDKRVISDLLDANRRSLLSQYVSEINKQKLINREAVDRIGRITFLNLLEARKPPKPETWRQLLLLWDYVAGDASMAHYVFNRGKKINLNIMPVQGKDVLYPGNEIVRIGKERLLHSQNDWDYISEFLLVLNQNWPRFLGEQGRNADQKNDDDLRNQVENAYRLLSLYGLADSSDMDTVFEQLSNKFFSQGKRTIDECIRLTQIAAALGARVPQSFQYYTIKGYTVAADTSVVIDIDGDLEYYVEREWCEKYVLNDSYSNHLIACTQAEWQEWIRSERSRLFHFVPLERVQYQIYGKTKVQRFMENRGINSDFDFPYKTTDFEVDDWDFDKEHWNYWDKVASEDPDFWGKLFTKFIKTKRYQWEKALYARVYQIATTGTKKEVTNQTILPTWVIKFREKPCLLDTQGFYRKPSELLRRTQETESLLGIEYFINAEFDTEENRVLLIKLGVQDKPISADRLIERIRGIADAEEVLVSEVERLMNRIDIYASSASTVELEKLREIFSTEKLILTSERDWVKSTEVFLQTNEQEYPEAATIYPSIRHLSFWNKIGVADYPTPDLIIKWLKEIPTEERLSSADIKRIKSVLPRFPEQIWNECKCWINLEGEWVPTSELSYKLTMQSLFRWGNLFPAVKKKTADLQTLPGEVCNQYPFSALKTLSSVITENVVDTFEKVGNLERKPWIQALGEGIARINYEDEAKRKRVHNIGKRLQITRWQSVRNLESIPYIDGTLVGTPRKIEALWIDEILYVNAGKLTKRMSDIANELSRPFDLPEIQDSIKYCIERSRDFVLEYFNENFTLITEELEEVHDDEAGQTVDTVPEIKQNGQDEEEIQPETEENGVNGGDADYEPGEQTIDIRETDSEATDTEEKTRSPKSGKIRLIEKFVLKQGFKKTNDPDRFIHDDGRWIQKSGGGVFHWEKYGTAGTIIQSYWIKEHILEKNELKLPADVWSLCSKQPDMYTLILQDFEGEPIEWSGKLIQRLINSGNLKLFPAEYRLSLIDGD